MEQKCTYVPHALNASINDPVLHFHLAFGCKSVAVDVHVHKILLSVRGSTCGTSVKLEYVIERGLNRLYCLLSGNKIVQTTCTDSRSSLCQMLVYLEIEIARNTTVIYLML